MQLVSCRDEELLLSDINITLRTAETTAECEFGPSGRMIYLERTVLAVAVGGLVPPCYSMAWVAIVRVAVAEPEAD